MDLVTVVLFALAVSTDGFVVGIAYGVKAIKIPVFSLLVISAASALAVTFSMLCGRGLIMVLPEGSSSKAGAVLIIGIGIYFLLRAWGERLHHLADEGKPLWSVAIKPMGVIIQILKEPSQADMDASGEISIREAFFLGLALALDALGAGIGIAMAGINIFFTAIAVGMLKFVLVNSGVWLGRSIEMGVIQNYSSVIPGIIFMIIGLIELF